MNLRIEQLRKDSPDETAARRLPFQLWRRESALPPPPRVDDEFSEQHPFYRYGHGARFAALRSGEVVARVGAYLNPHMPHCKGYKVGILGHFDATDDQQAGCAVIEAGMNWLHQNGAGRCLGPMDFSTWHRYRFVTWQGSHPPFLMEPQTPERYPDLFVVCGFKPENQYLSHLVRDTQPLIDLGDKIGVRLKRRGYRLRVANHARLNEELGLLYQLSSRMFRENPYFTPCPYEEFERIYRHAHRLLQAGLLIFAINPHGEHVGFVFGMPDLTDALRRVGGYRGPVARIALALARRRVRTVVAKTIAVDRDLRRRGLAGWLSGEFHRRCRTLGYDHVIHALMHEANPSTRMAMGQTTVIRRYAMFSCDL